MKGLTVWDIETTTTTSFKRKANPFDSENWTVLHGMRRGDQQELWRFGSERPKDGWLLPVLEGTRFLAGFNIKFDLLHALHNNPKNLEAWMAFVARGGLVWDCQLAEYLLNGMGQKEHMLSLDEVSPRYGGDLKHDEVKALWAAGVNTHHIEPELLHRYLGGGLNGSGEYQQGDLENTQQIALAQIQRAREAGQVNSILLNMGALIATTEMERNGMWVDKARGEKIAAELEATIAELRVELDKFLPETPFTFNWGSPRQKSALIFGGVVMYDDTEYLIRSASAPEGTETWWCEARDGAMPAGWAHVYSNKTEKHFILDNGTTMECGEYLGKLEGGHYESVPAQVFFASGKNKGEAKTKNVTVPDHTKPKKCACRVPYTFPQLTRPEPEWEGSTPGVYSTSADIIESLGNRDLPFLKAMARLQKLNKDLGTYYITTDEKTGEQKGMLTMVGPDGIVHHQLNHTSTVTGRLSCSNPNLQNLTKGDGSQVKSLFRSRWGADGCIIQSDFSSLEVYVQAILTHCRALIDDLKKGVDMHCMRVAAKEGKPYDEVLLLCKGDDDKGIEPVSEWKYKRTAAKEFSFQRAYGAGADKIAETTGMAVDDVKALIEAEGLRYPEVDEFYVELHKTLMANRRPTSTFVPHPTAPGKPMCQLGRSFYRTPDGALYGFMESPVPHFMVRKGQPLASFSPTEERNYPVQGTGGTWMKAALWLLVRVFYARKNWGGRALMVNSVHDAAYADTHNSVMLEVAREVHACMLEASTLMEYLFNWPLPLPVPSETTAGPSMLDDARINGLSDGLGAVRQRLRKEYMCGYVPTFDTGVP